MQEKQEANIGDLIVVNSPSFDSMYVGLVIRKKNDYLGRLIYKIYWNNNSLFCTTWTQGVLEHHIRINKTKIIPRKTK